jgi:hypothetical protein
MAFEVAGDDISTVTSCSPGVAQHLVGLPDPRRDPQISPQFTLVRCRAFGRYVGLDLSMLS